MRTIARLVVLVIGLGAVGALAPAPAAGAPAPAGYDLLDGARAGAYLRRGSRGQPVAALQRALNATGGAALAVDGDFGPLTEAAVRRFQGGAGLVADGVVGPATLAALDAALGIGGPSASPTPAPAPAQPPGAAPAPLPDPAPPAGLVVGSGSAFLARTASLSRPERERLIEAHLLAGDVPRWNRFWFPVERTAAGADGRVRTVTFFVLPDYLAIGGEADFVRIPMNPLTAQRVADRWGASLPTRPMVDAIWRAAEVKLRPQPLPPGPRMMSNDYFSRHHDAIEAQLAGQPRGRLTAGHKKDVVITDRLLARPGRVAIYGWHYPDGRPIQPLSTVHENAYADYSHGARLVHRTVQVDGRPMPLADVLADPVLHPLLSDEGAMRVTRVPGA